MNCHQQTRRKVIKTLYLLSATSTVQRGCFPDLKSNIQVSVFGDHPFAPNHRWRKAGPCAKRPGGLFRRCCCRQLSQSMRRRNNRPDQHRTKLRDLELRKIFSAGCASSRLLRLASRAECHCHRCPVLDLPNLRLHLRNQFRKSLHPPPFNQTRRRRRPTLPPHLTRPRRVP